ncbi:hypothetical protein [Flagellimonas onchidii]|uniref:hypothetical protein n=1 Tax=Flagellimonas onchidii TaxID=2562684 RepID=UPI0010A5BF68|nr:hypothetical protein [Allomuricauda onchidii]
MHIFKFNNLRIGNLGTRDLLTYLEKLEIGLSSFSYEELGTAEAGKLKRSFDQFKNGLEDNIFGGSEMHQLDVIYDQVGIENPNKKVKTPTKGNHGTETSDSDVFISLLSILQKTDLTPKQQEVVKALKVVGERIMDSNEISKTGSKSSDKIQRIEKNVGSFLQTERVNLKPVLRECMGQMELLEELIRLYKQNILEFIGTLKVHLQTENYRGVDFACQKIQPCLRMMKTVSLLEITEQMVTVCKTDNDLKYLNFLYNQFLVEYPKIDELVDFEVEVLRNM